jgi:two-component system CheB/CheR fusion protein
VTAEEESRNVESDPHFEDLLVFLRDARGFDFTGYKRASLTRRVERRMQDVGIEDFALYKKHISEHPEEFEALFNTILINVTEFFRDPPAWDFLRSQILPPIIDGRSPERPIRVWCAGCASGQEAFSVAMLFAELLPIPTMQSQVKIYATDIDEGALDQARHSVYTSKEVESVPEDLLKRYFEPTDGAYRLRSDLRRCVIFGRHDLIQDPPISRIDLLVCRNTLMYMTHQAQDRVLRSLDFSLAPSGFLFLGKSEALVRRPKMFEAVNLKARVFRHPTIIDGGDLPIPDNDPTEKVDETNSDDLAFAGLDSSPVPQLIVDREGRLAVANNSAKQLFGLSASEVGRPFKDLEISYKPIELRSQIDQVLSSNQNITISDVAWTSPGGTPRIFDVVVSLLPPGSATPIGVAISFTDLTRLRRLEGEHDRSQRELETAYEELQSAVEELETTNEELQSTNEELETTNEELQSANEELETMNEELRSTNEELASINDEIGTRTLELDDTNSFLDSILRGLDEGVVVVDRDLRIITWNPVATDMWGLQHEEVAGQNVLALDIGLPVESLKKPLHELLNGGVSEERYTLPSVNRRGQPFDCIVRMSPLAGLEVGGPAGIIIRMEPSEAS